MNKTLRFQIVAVIFLTSVNCNICNAQDVRLSPVIIPPSPTVSELGKYGLIPVGLSTGTINPSISLYIFKTKNLALPISLSYNSNAIKVDEVSSWVGMHFSLNCGGVVSRIVRDEADESSNANGPYPQDFSTQNPQAIQYIEDAGNNEVDTEPDLFTFNFAGYSGKFVIDRNGDILCMPRNDLLIQRTLTTGAGSFTITTPDGVKYTFDAPETSTMLSSQDATFPSTVTAWYLTRIEHPLGDVINLTYGTSAYTYYLGYSETFARSTQRNSCTFTGGDYGDQTVYCPVESSSNSTTQMYVVGRHLTKIESTGYGSVEFTATTGRSDLDDFKLDSFTLKDANGDIIKSISFGYVFSNNMGLAGAVTDSEELKHRMFLTSVVEKDAAGTQVRRHDFEYEDIDGLPARLSYAQDHWGYFNGADNSSFLPTNLVETDYTGGPAFQGIGGNRELHIAYAGKGQLKKIVFPTGGYSTFLYEGNTYYDGTANVGTGGMRISQVTNYDPFTQKSEVIHYYYSRHDQLSISSGRTASPPDYVTRYFLRNPCTGYCGYYDCPYVALNSNNTTSLFLTSNNVYYKYVTISRGDNLEFGAEEHEFTISFDNTGTQMWGSDYIKDAPLSNTAWDNENERYVRYFSNVNGTLVLTKQIENRYTSDSRYHKEVAGLAVRKKFEPFCKQDAVYECDASNINKVYQYYTCITSHRHILTPRYFLWEPDEWICRTPGANNQWVTYQYHPCYGKAIGDTAIQPYNLSYLDALEYKNISDWVYLDKTIETTYDPNGANPVMKEIQYIYDNDVHMQLSRVVTTTSEGKEMEMSTKYPQDFTAEGNEVISALLDKHIINAPLKKESTVNGNLINGDVTIYNVKGQPTNVYLYESSALKPPPSHDPTLFIPSSDYKLRQSMEFDAITGNVAKIQLTDNFSTVYLWGYNNTLPIAEVKNADNSSVEIDFNTYNDVSAEVNHGASETALLPTFELFSTQIINPSLLVVPEGTNIPSDPSLIIVLKKADGTVVQSYSAAWGQTDLGSISLTPGVYQWYYYGGDVAFNNDFTGFGFSISTSYVSRQTVYSVFHTSFEEDGVINTSARTGAKVWSGLFNLNLPATNGNYKLTYWKKTGANPWTLVEQAVTVTSGTVEQISIGDSESVIDEVRVYPVDAHMTTYTYDPLVGTTSVTDSNNITTYYEYDAFGRLKAILDTDGNVLKSYSYNYMTR